MKPAVLVVDDEPSIADGLRLILEREGYAVDTAGSIAEAPRASTPRTSPSPSSTSSFLTATASGS